MNLPDQVAVMPLPNAILFPRVLLPLYIFEARYRQMLEDCLKSDRIFAVALTRSVGGPLPYPVAGIGVIRTSILRPDGTSNLILEGMARVRIIEYVQTKPYRLARVAQLDSIEPDTPASLDQLIAAVQKLAKARAKLGMEFPKPLLTSLLSVESADYLTDLVSYTLLEDCHQKQHLLETLDVSTRLGRLLELLEEQTSQFKLWKKLQEICRTTMSDITDIAEPVPPPVLPAQEPPLARLSGRDLTNLLVGFYFLFWCLLGVVTAVTETVVTPFLRAFSVFIITAGSVGMAVGARRLQQVRGLGESWRKRTRDLFFAAMLLAYLSLFYVMWRRLPTQLYLLAHAMAFLGLLLVTVSLLCLPVAVLARAAERRNLAVQCVLFSTLAVVMLLPPFGLMLQTMVLTAQQGHDPFNLLHYWIENTPIWLMLLLFLPFSLTLSLLWSAKDLVWERLNVMSPDNPAAGNQPPAETQT